MQTDGRNFDDLVERLSARIHGGLKGQLRLRASKRQMQKSVPELSRRKLNVLDVGAGLGQMSLWLAAEGHTVTALDISQRMVEEIGARAAQQDLDIRCLHGSLQTECNQLLADHAPFDLVCCHAALEWMTEPEEAVRLLRGLLRSGGALSLLCYNNAALVHRNLLRGNFRRAQLADPPQTEGGLTPTHLLELETLEHWLEQTGLVVDARFGVRALLDFLPPQLAQDRGLETLDQIEQWLEQREPHWRLARYLHIIARA